ncbi:MAG: fumarylacetoacetate hydrolase family protein [Acetobacteraceae bacterium]
MDQREIEATAEQLVRARRAGTRVQELPVKPASVAEAHAIQDAVAASLGEAVGAFKANAPPGEEPNRGLIYARTIQESPARFSDAEAGDRGVEGEIAFRFRRDLPKRPAPYTRAEVADAVDACAAIELVSSRFADHTARSALEKLADCVSNAGFVPGETVRHWKALDLPKLHVVLSVNGETVLEHDGGHPIGDPLAVAVALVNMVGVKAGQYVTCGSCTGLRFLKSGDSCAVRFEGLGVAALSFA